MTFGVFFHPFSYLTNSPHPHYNEDMKKKNERKILLKIRSQLRYKLFFYYTIPMIIFFGFMVIFCARILQRQANENAEIYRIPIDQQIIQSIDSNMQLLDKQSTLLYASPQNLSDLFEIPANSRFYAARQELYTLLATQLNLNDNLDGVALLTLDGTPFLNWSRHGYSLNNYNSFSDEWFQEVLTLEGRPLVRVNHTNAFYYDSTPPLVSISRVLYSNTRTPLGVVVVYEPLSYVTDLLSADTLRKNETLLLIDGDGQIIYSNGPALDQTASADYKEAESGTGTVELDGSSYFRSVSPATKLGWHIVSYLSTDTQMRFSELVRNVNLLLLLILVLFSFILSAVMAFLVTKPLKLLAHAFRQVGEGNLDAAVPVKGTDEIAMISTAFNQMLLQTKSFIHEQYEMKLLVTKAELEALQSQINPHFLFNTLNSIKSVISSGDSRKAMNMVQVLADLLRYNLSRGEYQVSFAEDLDITKKYLYLQQCRFGDTYEVDYDIDEAVLPLSILKLTLQPLVENAIRHGLEHTSQKGRLHIVARRLGNIYIIYIANTGRIIEARSVREINEQLQMPLSELPLTSEHLGIFNVNRRIRLHYGDEYGLQFSRSEAYTTVRITLPALLCEAPVLEQTGGNTNGHSDH